MIRRVTGLAVVAAVAGVSFLTGSTIPSASAATGPLVWSDEFNGATGTAPDTTKWGRDLGGGGFGNQELEFYTNGAANAAMDGQGHLVITARRENPTNNQCWYGRCQYTSARLNTNGKFTTMYGHIEARIKMPRGQGIWPAFWSLGSNLGSVGWPTSGEMDIMEAIGRQPSTNFGSLHGPGYSGGSALTSTFNLPGGQLFADAFHVFAIDWAPNLVAFSVDGTEYARRTPADARGNAWVFNHPFFLIMNVAVGGAFPGNPDATSTFPQQMTVDYVRVFAPASGNPPPTTPPPTTPPPTTPPTTPPPTTPPSGTAWAAFTTYAIGQVVTYNGASYRCRQAHQSLPGWEPPNALALWTPA
jgi:beta-glucanase (GH16 family)